MGAGEGGMRQDGRVIVVSGGSGGIGRACVLSLAALGATVVAGFHRNGDAMRKLELELAEQGRTVLSVSADLATPEGPGQLVDAALSSFGRVDGCVTAAGLSSRRLAVGTCPQALDAALRINLGGAIGLARACLRPMIRARYGRIVLFGSRAGIAGLPGSSAYAAAKGGLAPWAASVAGEVGKYNVTVNVVAPGAIRGDATEHSAAEQDLAIRLIGAGRLGEPAEVAAAVSFLLSAEASYVNGSTLVVDGGARF
jgi:3-oxoacyl-[acyl-carrier protein] reductase